MNDLPTSTSWPTLPRIFAALCFLLLPISAMANASTAIQTEVSPYGTTLLFTSDHAPFPDTSRQGVYQNNNQSFPEAEHYHDNAVALFIPHHLDTRKLETLNLVFYFHGWYNNIQNSLNGAALREQLVASQRNAILVFPQGPYNAADSSGGKLERPGHFDQLIEEVIAHITNFSNNSELKLGNITLTGHSGAYRVMAQIAANHTGDTELAKHLTEIYLLDASYALLKELADWVAADESRHLGSVFTNHLAEDNTQLMAMLQARGVPFGIWNEQAQTPEEAQHFRATFFHTQRIDHTECRNWFKRFLLLNQPLREILEPEDILNPLQWNKRVILIFKDASNQVAQEQHEQFTANQQALDERDLTVITIPASGALLIDGIPQPDSEALAFRESFDIKMSAADGFAVILIGKDGGEKSRNTETTPWSNFAQLIDSMPMRQSEMRRQSNQ